MGGLSVSDIIQANSVHVIGMTYFFGSVDKSFHEYFHPGGKKQKANENECVKKTKLEEGKENVTSSSKTIHIKHLVVVLYGALLKNVPVCKS